MSKLTLDEILNRHKYADIFYLESPDTPSYSNGLPEKLLAFDCEGYLKEAKQQILQAINRAEPENTDLTFEYEPGEDNLEEIITELLLASGKAIKEFKQNLLKELGLEEV